MNSLTVTDGYVAACPIRNVLSRVSSKWALIVLHELDGRNALRFNALHNAIPDISQKMLTATLRSLVADGFVARKVYPEVPPRVEYSLTDRGRSFMGCANTLIAWAIDNMGAIIKDRERNEKAS